jgi:hypothetical protein
MIETDSHFLSATNPLATAEQRELEARAIRLLETEAVRRARSQTEMRWRTLAVRDAPVEAWDRFGELIEEFAFNYALKAVAGDPHHPAVLGMVYCPPHDWLGLQVPGSRGSGGDGPDQHYVLIPVSHGAHYEIEGRRFEPVPADIPLTVTGNPSLTMTLSSLDLRRIDVAADGRYRLTAGPEPADGNPNHVHVPPGAMYLFIRECRSDWRQLPSALRVRRTDPPSTEPWSDEQAAARAAAMMVEDVAPIWWFQHLLEALEPNTVPAPYNTGTVGGLVSQSVMFARLQVDPGHAFVFEIGAGGARYHGIALYDYWFRTLDYWQRQSTLNRGQSLPNPDGSYTYVVAQEDPGVANWLDPDGLEHLLVIHRWQGIPVKSDPAHPEDPPSASGRLVPVAELDSVLGEGVPRVSPAERRAALAERLESFRLRFRTD